MKNKMKHSLNDYFEFSLYLLALICFVYFLPTGNVTKISHPILIVALLASMRVLIIKTKIEVFPALRFSFLGFVFIAMFLAVEFNFYSWVPYLDKIEHLLSGIILCFSGFSIFKYINRNEEKVQISPLTIVLFSLFFSIAVAGCWEIYEFTVDHLFGLTSQNGSLVDTMTDIICGTTSGIITSIYLYNKLKKHDKKFAIHQTENM